MDFLEAQTAIEVNNVSLEAPKEQRLLFQLRPPLRKSGDGSQAPAKSEARKGRVLLDGISFKIEAGERVALLGKNGAGKTSLLRLLSGIYIPTGGSVTIRGRVRSLLDLNIGIDPRLTGIEAIYARGLLLGFNRKALQKKLGEIGEFTGLEDRLYSPTSTYSSGMLLRIAAAVSLAFPADILLLDEWLSVGDKDFSIRIETALEDFLRETSVMVIATHSEALVKRVATKAMVISNGQLISFGATEQVGRQYFGGTEDSNE